MEARLYLKGFSKKEIKNEFKISTSTNKCRLIRSIMISQDRSESKTGLCGYINSNGENILIGLADSLHSIFDNVEGVTTIKIYTEI